MTAFNVAASLEIAGQARGGRGLFGWMMKLPYFNEDNYLFGYFICGLILFIFGGITGIINASYSLNQMVHNTAWMPGHFHMTVAGPVFLAILGLSIYIYSTVSGRPIRFKTLNVIVPYVWLVGVAMFSYGLMAGGLMGEPRRTNLGLSYTDPSSPLFNSHWVPTTTLTMIGGITMGVASVLYFMVFFATAFGKSVNTPEIILPEAEEFHEEKPMPMVFSMRPWIVVMVIVIFIAYVPALKSVFKYGKPVNNRFKTESPVNELDTLGR
jgi:cytochrome c oxidase subunit 1